MAKRAAKALNIKIADFCGLGAGALVTKALGDFGAEVVKIESKVQPDPSRTLAPYRDGIPGIDRSGMFATWNTSKHSIAVDLDKPEGIEIVRKLVAWADVVSENFSPGFMEKRGLSYEELRKINPGIIMLRTSGLGHTGPAAKQPAFGFNIHGLIGYVELIGWPDRAPAGIPLAYTDVVAPWYAIASVLTALSYRRRSGKGQCIELSQAESGLDFLAPAILDYTANGRIQKRCGNRADNASPHGVYPCRGDDRWLAIGVENEVQWRALRRVAEAESRLSDKRFNTLAGRKQNEDELDILISAWTLGFDAYELMKLLQSKGVPAGVVQSARDIMETDPQLKSRGYFEKLEHPEMGNCEFQHWSFKLSKTPSRLRRPPMVGEHSEYVCTELLGMSDEEFVQALGCGAIQ